MDTVLVCYPTEKRYPTVCRLIYIRRLYVDLYIRRLYVDLYIHRPYVDLYIYVDPMSTYIYVTVYQENNTVTC